MIYMAHPSPEMSDKTIIFAISTSIQNWIPVLASCKGHKQGNKKFIRNEISLYTDDRSVVE